jgi:hypothetical protein
MTSVVEPAQHSEGLKQLQRRLKPGDTIFVSDRQGDEVTGKLTRLSSASLVIVVNGDEREIPSTNIGRIEKRGGVGSGTLISTGFFTWIGMASAGASCSPHCANAVTAAGVSFGAIAFAIGALRDRTHHRTPVYGIQPDSPHALRPGSPVDAFGELWTRVNAGDTIDVLDASGRRTTGTLEQISASSIALRIDGQLREISESEVRQVARRGNRLWTGALIGAGVGAVEGAKGSADYQGAHPLSGALFGVVPLMAIGALIGAGIPRHTVLYSTTSSTKVAVAPLVSAGRKGLAVSFTF